MRQDLARFGTGACEAVSQSLWEQSTTLSVGSKRHQGMQKRIREKCKIKPYHLVWILTTSAPYLHMFGHVNHVTVQEKWAGQNNVHTSGSETSRPRRA